MHREKAAYVNPQTGELQKPCPKRLLLIENGSTSQPFELVAGQSYARKAGVEHNVVNGSPHPIAFVEIELK